MQGRAKNSYVPLDEWRERLEHAPSPPPLFLLPDPSQKVFPFLLQAISAAGMSDVVADVIVQPTGNFMKCFFP